MELVFLGTGTSHGIPLPRCGCKVCRSCDPRYFRTRCSCLFRINGLDILVDTATEFRLQAIAAEIQKIDAVLITHDHADHLHGIDDLRVFCDSPIPVYAQEPVLNALRLRFGYIFQDHTEGGGVPSLELRAIQGPFAVGSARIIPIPLWHGSKEILGFRIGNTAYCTDCSAIPETSYPLLENLDVLVIDALRFERHSTHFDIPEALEEIKRIHPRRAFFTHLCHTADPEKIAPFLPAHVTLAFDGLRISCE